MSSIAVSVIYFVDRYEVVTGANGQATMFINPLSCVVSGRGVNDRWVRYPYAALTKGTNNKYIGQSAQTFTPPFIAVADRIQ